VRALRGVVVLGVLVAGLAGCHSSPSSVSTSPSAAPSASPAARPVPVVPTVGVHEACTRVQAAISDRLVPLGKAFGQYVGYQAAGDRPDRNKAAAAVRREITGLADAVTDATSAVSDAALRSAASRATAAVTALAADPDYLSDIDDLDDIPPAISKLEAAFKPLTDACA
jgi:hypothetical protein